jgi:NADPH:quinone reductase-like Zn-dependent oxidoreductase
VLQRRGHYPAPPGAPAEIPGLEFAGEVAEVGPATHRWREGDRVFGITAGGAHAEYVAAHERALAAVPDNLDWSEAAAVPEAFITAHDALTTQAHVRRGEAVLVHAVGSGVGLAALQLAHALGALPFGTARTAEKIARAREYGLADGLTLRDDLAPLPDAVKAWTEGRGADVVLDLVGGDYVAASVAAAALRARIILIGTVAGRSATIPLGTMLAKRLTMIGTVLRSRSLDEKIAATAAFERIVVPLLADGTVRPVIDTTLALADIRAAHERMESNATFGKVVLRIEE